jgi:hypothetical protein
METRLVKNDKVRAGTHLLKNQSFFVVRVSFVLLLVLLQLLLVMVVVVVVCSQSM